MLNVNIRTYKKYTVLILVSNNVEIIYNYYLYVYTMLFRWLQSYSITSIVPYNNILL